MADWDSVADRYDVAYGDPVCRAENRTLRRWIRQADTGGTVTDLGCGTGLVLDLLPELTPRYLGIDVSEGMLRVAKGKHPTAGFAHADLTQALTWRHLPRGGTAICLFAVTELGPINRVMQRIADLQPTRALVVAYGPGPATRAMLELTGPPATVTASDLAAGAVLAGLRTVWLKGWRRVPEPRFPALTVPLEGLLGPSYHPPRYIAALLT